MIVPVTRKEKLLNAIATSSNVDFSPRTREELFLFKILGADVNAPTPITRKELLYQHIIDGTIPTFEPRTRLEKFIMVAAGAELELPVVLTREEYWWAEISDSAYETITGAIVHFISKRARAIKSLIANISYTQDLHGYSYPWPAGGGKNKFNGTFLQGYWAYANGTWVNSLNWITTEKIPCKASTSYTVSADAKMTRWQGFVWYDSNGNFISTDNLQSNVNIGLTKTSPSNAAYLIFNIAGYPNASDTIAPSDVTHFQLEEGSSSTAYAPYSNICPISGWTGANVTRCGKNFAEIDSAWIGRSGTHNGITWRFNEDGSMTLDGTKTTSTASVLIWNLANAARISGTQSDNKKHIPNGDYFIYSGHNKVVIQVYGSNDENAGASNSYPIASGNLNPVGFTINDTYKYNWIRLNIGGNAVFDNYTFYPMVRLASDTGTEQAPYTGATYSVTFPSEAGTVYGGTVDVTTGKLTVTMAMRSLNGTENWAKHGSIASWFYVDTIFDNCYVNNSLSGFAISSQYTQTSYTNAPVLGNGEFCIGLPTNGIHNRIVIKDTAYNTVAEFKASLASNNVQICYELATQQTYQLTPTEVTTLLGENTIWADTGDVTVTY